MRGSSDRTPSDAAEQNELFNHDAGFNLWRTQVVFGVVSSDVLRAVAAAEVARPAMQGDRMTALASHLVGQRRCPPPASLSH